MNYTKENITKNQLDEFIVKGFELSPRNHPKNCQILIMRFNGISLRKIGETVELTPERIRQIEDKSVLIIRRRLGLDKA